MSLKKTMSSGAMVVLLTMAIVLVDQLIKIWVKTHMCLHETIDITGWFKLCFVENIGMAYGMAIGSKLLLSIFRVVLIILLIRYLYRLLHNTVAKGYIFCLTMILGGAIGNLIDGMFYGLLFSASTEYYVAYPVAFATGYADFMMGKVVDMFYFPIIDTYWPQWLPFVGGNRFIFFSPVFNFADACISVGVILLVLFYRKEISGWSSSKSNS